MQAIILGSGFSAFIDEFEVVDKIHFSEFMEINLPILDGHERCLYILKYQQIQFIVFSGRLHLYEGFSFSEVNHPLRFAVEKWGLSSVMVTSACGGLSDKVQVGAWSRVDNFICIPQLSVFSRSQESISVKRRFEVLEYLNYAFHLGPNLGTVAEYKMLALLGADLVGMSSFPEWLYLQKVNLPCTFLSLPVCNYHPFIKVKEASHSEVLDIGNLATPQLRELFINQLMLNT